MNKILEFSRIAFRNISRQKTRSALTMLGIFIGIAAIVALISLGQGMKTEINSQFQDLGNDKIFIQPKTSLLGMSGSMSGSQLTTKDVEFLEQENGVEGVSFYASTTAKIEFSDSTRYYLITGVPTDTKSLELISSMWSSDIYAGELLSPGDNYKADLGFYHAEKNLYGGKNMDVHSRFTINDVDFTAKGFYEPIGDSIDDKMIIIPYKTFEELSGVEDRVDFIIVHISDPEKTGEISDQITRDLTRYRGLEQGKEDFDVQTPEDLLESFNTIINIVQGVFIGIALISLLVGIIGIMNTMYTSVLERKKEIGIMKAIGAQNKDIAMIFIIESGFLGMAGGIIGIILGISLSTGVEIISTKILGASFL